MLGMIKKFPLAWLWLVLVFLSSGLVINVIQLFLLPLWFVNKNVYRWLNRNVVYLHWCQLTFLASRWGVLDIKLYGTKEDFDNVGKENAVVVPNHRSDIDWLIGWVIAEQAGVLGTTKCYMKGYLKFLPIMGFSWWSTEYAFLNRNWEQDQNVLKKSLETLRDFPYPFWMVIFAEGTRFTEAKLKSSREYAQSKGLPELKHHLLPRPRGLSITLHHFQDTVPVVYDMEVAFPKTQPRISAMLQGEGFEVHLWIRRIPMMEIPKDSIEATSNWCRELFQEKDKNMSYFVEHGEFPAERREYPGKCTNLIIVCVWSFLVAIPFLWYFRFVLSSGSMLPLWIVTVFLLAGFVSLKILLHFSDSKKGSSFGLKSKAQVTKERTVKIPKKSD